MSERENMSIREFNARKKLMESELFESIDFIVKRFKQDTGYSPHYIRINIEEPQRIGEDAEYVVISVDTDVKI